MRTIVRDLAERNGRPDGVADLVLELARLHLAALDKAARSADVPVEQLLDELELEHLDDA